MDLLELFVKIGVDDSGLDSGLSSAESKSESTGSKIASALGGAAKVGAAAIAAIGTSTVAAGTALVNGAKNVAEYGDNIDKMSQKMGISAEAYQEWDAVLQHSGTSIDSMSRGMQTLQKNAVNSADKFEKLGISQEQLASMSTEDLFAATIEGLQNMGEGAERTALASELLGGSAKELGALLNTSAADTQAMKDRVHELGGVMSDEAVKNAAAFQDQLQDMQTSFQGLSRNLLSEFMPSLTTVMGGLTDIFSGDEGGISKVSEGIDTLIDGVTNALPNLISAGSQIVVSLGTAIARNLPNLLSCGADAVLTITKGLIQNLPQIVKAGMEAIVSLAKGLAVALPDLIPSVVEAVLTIANVLIDNIDLIIDAGIELTLGLATGLIEALPKLIEKAPILIEKLLQAIIRNAPKIAEAGLKLIEMLAKALVTNIPKLISKIPQIISSLVSAFKGALSAIASIGTNIVQGIWSGISSSLGWIKNRITEWVGNVVDFFKKVFKISSPSKVMRDEVGKWLGLGVYEGWENNNPIDMIKDDIGGLTNGMAVSVNTVGRSGSSSNTIIDYDRLADATVTAFTRAGIGIEIDKREFGRITRGVINYA